MPTNPGSPEAKRLGCLCSALDNHYGQGAVVDDKVNPDYFMVADDCPIHVRRDRVEGLPPDAEARKPGCHAGKDGECYWPECPQEREGEPAKSGRSCPLAPQKGDE